MRLFISSWVIMGWSVVWKKVGALALQTEDFLKELWEISWSYRRLTVFRIRIESIRRRRNSIVWESLDRRWGKLVETGIILTIVLLPVICAWEVLLVLIMLLYIIRFPARKTLGTGLLFFCLVLVISSLMASGPAGIKGLVPFIVWLSITGLAGRTFSIGFSRRVLGYILSASLIWMVIGFWQQWSGAPTSSGWLEQGQIFFISVRSFSVFGNPNIYGLYLLSILVFGLSGITSKNPLYRAVSWPILSLTVLSLIYCYSRTAWILGIAAVVGWFGKRLFQAKYIPVCTVIFSLLCIVPGLTARIIGTDLLNNTFWLRVNIWRDLLRVLADYWLWGSGPDSFLEIFATYPRVTKGLPQHGHQLYLELWLEHGILTLLVFVRVMVKNLTGLTGISSCAKAIVLVIVLFLAAGFMETWWVSKFCGGFFWLLIGMLQSMRAGQIDS